MPKAIPDKLSEADYLNQLQAVNPEQREAALKALGDMKSTAALHAIITLLKDEKVIPTRCQAIKSLGEIGGAEAIATLLQLFQKDENDELRASAAYALGKLSPPEAIPVLTACIQNKKNNFDLLLKACLALSSYETREAWDALRVSLSKDIHPGLRPRIITSLGKAGYAPAAKEIQQALAPDQDEEIRRAAIKALVAIQGANSIPALSQLLKEKGQTRLQLRVIQNLQDLDDPAAIPSLSQAMLDIDNDGIRDALKNALVSFNDWKYKTNSFLSLLENESYSLAGLPADEIIASIAPDVEELSKNRYLLTDLFIQKAQEVSNPRILEILSALIRASTYGDQNAAGERLNSFAREHALPQEKLDQLRILIGGETALSPMLSMLSADLEKYFRIPIKSLNDTTQNNWQTTIRYAQYGFIARIIMSVVVFIIGITLMSIASYQFMFAKLDMQLFFGNGISFVSGLSTMLLIIFKGPLKEIRRAVEDLGTANAAFIAYIHRVLQTSHTFSLYYLQQRMSFDEMEKSSKLIQEAMNQTIDRLSTQPKRKDT